MRSISIFTTCFRAILLLAAVTVLAQAASSAPTSTASDLEAAKSVFLRLQKEMGDPIPGEEGTDWWVAEVEPHVNVLPYFCLEIRYRKPGGRVIRVIMNKDEVIGGGSADAFLSGLFKSLHYPKEKTFTARELVVLDQVSRSVDDPVVWTASKEATAPRLEVTTGNGRELAYCYKGTSGLQRRTLLIASDGTTTSKTETLSR